MCVYKGNWSRNEQQVNAEVTVDGQPLPILEEPGLGNVYGWGNASPWASEKLLAYSIMYHELGTKMALPQATAYKFALLLGNIFVDQWIAKLDKQWSLTSEDIIEWVKQYHADLWSQLMRGHAAT